MSDHGEVYLEATSPLNIDSVLRVEGRARDLAQSNQTTEALPSATNLPILASDSLNSFHHKPCYHSYSDFNVGDSSKPLASQ